MSRTTPILALLIGVATIFLLASSSAAADVTSCAFNGVAGPLSASDPKDGGVESILTDLNQNEGLPLLDDDNSSPTPDGTYHFDNVGSTVPTLCLAVDDVGEASTDTGLYSAVINSNGTYENLICGTGTATSGAAESTTVDFTPIAATGPGENYTNADYDINFFAGVGYMPILSVRNTDGESGLTGLAGVGVVTIVPTNGNCINEDVVVFRVAGVFATATN